MNILEAKNEIKRTVKTYLMKDEDGQYRIPVLAQRPILLIGPPGIGKTAIVDQVAKECGLGLVAYTMTHHTRQSAIGLPLIEKHTYEGKEYSATEYTMSEIIESIYATMSETGKKQGILFLDEINCVSETLAPAMLSLLQRKMFGTHKVPDGWIIIGAGNPPEYNKSVRDFDIVTLDRVRKLDITQDFTVWKSYAYEYHVHPSIISYLEIKKENFYQIETTVSGKQFVTARGWEDLSYLIYALEEEGEALTEETVQEYLQFPKIARDFANYYDLYNQYKEDYQVGEIMEGRISQQTVSRMKEARFDEKLSMIGLLMGYLDGDFKAYEKQNDLTQKLYEILQNVKAAGTRNSKEMSACLQEQMDSLDEKGNGKILKVLADYQKLLAQKEDFSALRNAFSKEVDRLEEITARTQEHLNAAFDFLETTFGSGQEMVIFVTELNTSKPATNFIQQNGCERYYHYNELLLFHTQDQKITREIEALRPYMDLL